MVWNQVVFPWQVAIEQAWLAYCAGSLPIGAAIVSPDGQIIATGRNRMSDGANDGDLLHLRQHFMAHAEQNAFISLGKLIREQPTIKKQIAGCVLYTTLEPCDMCVGTLIQSGVKHVQYLVPDPSGGAIDTLTATLHTRQKHIAVHGPQPGAAANIVLALLTIITMQAGMTMPEDVIAFLHDFEDGLTLGKMLADSGELAQFREQQIPVSSLYNALFERLHSLQNANSAKPSD